MELDLDIWIKSSHRGTEIVNVTFTEEDLLEWARVYVAGNYSDSRHNYPL